MATHDGHRARLRAQVEQFGLESLSDVQLLELLLQFSIPRIDTNPIAHALLERFGSVSRVLDASPEELREIPGIGENSALLLTLLPALLRKYQQAKAEKGSTLTTTDEIAGYLAPYFLGKTEECAYLLSLDAKGRVLACNRLSEGEINGAEISIRKVLELTLRNKAVLAVLAHNHISGNTEPSQADLATTEQVSSALNTIGVRLVDHVILSERGRYTSLLECGKMPGKGEQR